MATRKKAPAYNRAAEIAARFGSSSKKAAKSKLCPISVLETRARTVKSNPRVAAIYRRVLGI